LEQALDHVLIAQAKPALESGKAVVINTLICNVNRTFGTMLSGEVAKRYGHKGLPEDTIAIHVKGTAGQSFGAFLAQGISIELEGEGNDYVGKGMSGGRIAIFPPKECPIIPEENIIVGNTVLYGAISGECYFNGVAGERFAVRNSGAIAVVEGVGDHGCEYMTGGVVVVLGKTGRNFAAGMSGGVAYVLDKDTNFDQLCNLAMVELEPIPVEDDILETVAHQGGDMETHGRVHIMSDMTRHDAQRLKHLIQNHKHYTGSPRAQHILENWSDYLPRFIKVMPVDYRAALKQIQAEQATASC
jgi:glutamate synthase (NADPH/NADH) large chain